MSNKLELITRVMLSVLDEETTTAGEHMASLGALATQSLIGLYDNHETVGELAKLSRGDAIKVLHDDFAAAVKRAGYMLAQPDSDATAEAWGYIRDEINEATADDLLYNDDIIMRAARLRDTLTKADDRKKSDRSFFELADEYDKARVAAYGAQYKADEAPDRCCPDCGYKMSQLAVECSQLAYKCPRGCDTTLNDFKQVNHNEH